MDLGINTSAPQTIAMDALEQNILNDVFGNTALGPLMPMLTPYLNRMAGLQGPGWRNPIMDSVIFSNMTPYGTYQSQLQNRFNRVANTALNRASNAARQKWVENIGRTMMSFDSWKNTETGKNYASIAEDDDELRRYYDDYISNEALGRDGFLWQTGYNMLDPEGFEASRTYLAQAGANLIRNGAIAGRRTAYMQARAVGNMFLDDKGEYNFKASDYGFMNVGEASAVAAELTKDTDLFSDAGYNPEKLKKATDALRTKVQEYTKALGPLKDIFGSDVPKMIEALQGLSGQRLSQMDPAKVASLTANVVAGHMVGGYSINEAMAQAGRMRQYIDGMNVPFINAMGAASQGLTYLNATSTGLAPAAMTEQRYLKNVEDMVVRTSNSQGAEYVNLAYAAWRARDENKDKDFNAFQKEYDALRKDMSTDAVIMRLGGTTDYYQLRNLGYKSKYFSEAIETDVGGRIARNEQLNTLISNGYLQATSDERDDYLAAVSAVQGDIRLLTDNKYLEEQGLSKGVTEQIQMIRQGFYGESLLTGLHANAELRRKAPIMEKQIRLRESLEKVKEAMPTGIKDIINNFISGEDSLEETLYKSDLYAMADPETQEMMRDVAMATSEQLDDLGITDDKERQDFAEKFLTYGFQYGYEDEGFTSELMRYSDSQKTMRELTQDGKIKKLELSPEDAKKYEDAENAATMASKGMYMARFVDQAKLTAFIGMGEGAKDRRADAINVFWEAMSDKRGLSDEEAGYEVEDYMTVADIGDKLTERKFGVKHEALDKKFRSRLAAAAKERGSLGKDQVFSIIEDLQKDTEFKNLKPEVFYNLKSIANMSFQRESDTSEKPNDQYGLISDAIKKMGELSTDMRKILDMAGYTPAEHKEGGDAKDSPNLLKRIFFGG